MTSLLRDRKVDVHILYRSKFNDRKIWAEEELSISGTEATLKHPRNDVYVMEVSERGDSKIVLTIDFRKIKSYTMRARCWHEVKYEGRMIALRFTENETFDDFYTMLEQVLRIYRKFTKPKNDRAFLQEVEMFQLKQLKPVENVRVDRSVSLGTTEQESPSSSGTLQGGKTRVTAASRSLDTICQRERLPRLPDSVENKKQVKKNLPPPPQKKKTPSQADGGTSLNRLPPQTNPKPNPQRSPPIVPPPRISGDYQNDPYADPSLFFETPEPAWRSDTSDEDSGDQNSSNYAAGTTYGSKDDEAFEPPRPLLPARTSASSTDSSASDPTEPSRPGDNRQRKPKPSHNHAVSASPPLPPKQETRKCFKQHDPATPSTLSPSRDKRPTTFQPPAVKTTGPPIAPNPPPKRNNDLKRQDLPPGPHPNHPLPPPPTPPFQPDQRPRPSHPSTPPSTPPVQPDQRPRSNHPSTPPVQPPQLPSSTYGMAMHWACKCTLQNDFWKLNCGACDWLRTDAWQCLDCPTVYSNDVTRCFTCDVWRCRLCTTLNRGEQTEWTLCHVCNQ